ncbi:hypothetical protein LXL04_029573 [Taraxacum kok-saghyz]
MFLYEEQSENKLTSSLFGDVKRLGKAEYDDTIIMMRTHRELRPFGVVQRQGERHGRGSLNGVFGRSTPRPPGRLPSPRCLASFLQHEGTRRCSLLRCSNGAFALQRLQTPSVNSFLLLFKPSFFIQNLCSILFYLDQYKTL